MLLSKLLRWVSSGSRPDSPVQAGTPTTIVASEQSGASDLAKWWNGKYAGRNWFGVRDTLEDYGLTLGGNWTGVFYGVVDGGKPNVRGGFFDEEIQFTGELNVAKLTGLEPLEGLKGFGEVRWRDGLDPNLRAGASSNFQPSHFQSGKQWRLMTFGLTYTTPEVFGVKEFLTVTGGWIQPQREFIDQPLSQLFVNDAFESSKGIGANIPFSSSFSTWGGTLKIKPLDWYYAKAGLFMSYPEATSTDNHGLAFEGFGRDPSQNGLFAIGETGFTPKIGASKLSGKYAFGGFYYEQQNTSFFGTPYPEIYFALSRDSRRSIKLRWLTLISPRRGRSRSAINVIRTDMRMTTRSVTKRWRWPENPAE